MADKDLAVSQVNAVDSDPSESWQPPVKNSKINKIRGIIWDSLDKSPEERRYVLKVDIVVMTYVCLSYFIKYLDAMSFSNAYVSGMKETLEANSSNYNPNWYNYMSTYYYVGYIVGQIPSQYIINRIRPSIWLPTMEICYGAFVMGMAGAKDINTMYALRFFVGLFESTAYITIMTLLSNFYLPDELGKRTSIFQTSSSAAQMFAGYLQSGLHSGMNGKGGLEAWRWLFIFDGIITMPVAIAGFFAIPDEPFSSKAKWFTEKDRKIAIGRAKRSNRNTRPNIKLKHFIDLFKDWPFYLFSLAFTVHVLGIRLYGFMNLWLKDSGDFSISQINNLPTVGFAIQIVSTLIWAWLSDGIGKRWPIIVLACTPAIIGSVILWVWPENNRAALFAGWYLLFMETGAGALFISWISETLSTNVEMRYLMIGIVEAVAFAFTAWVPIYLFPASDAPHYKYAYPITFMFFSLEALTTLVMAAIQYFEKKGKLTNKHYYEVYEDDGDKPLSIDNIDSDLANK